MNGFECLQTIKTRLNMLPVYGNYKADLTMERLCPHCKKEDDTTEHLINCEKLGTTILQEEDLECTDNNHTWKMINERIKFNLQHRSGKLNNNKR